MTEKTRKNLIAAIIALILVGIITATIFYFVHSQNENREKYLKITPTFTGPSTNSNQ